MMIPSVELDVTPLLDADEFGLSTGNIMPDAYAVRLRLLAPADADTEWLEFGFARHNHDHPHETNAPKVDIARASVDGVPVHFETSVVAQDDRTRRKEEYCGDPIGLKWVTWVKVRVGEAGGVPVEVDYHASDLYLSPGGDELSVLVPAFLLPIGRLEVRIESMPGPSLSPICLS